VNCENHDRIARALEVLGYLDGEWEFILPDPGYEIHVGELVIPPNVVLVVARNCRMIAGSVVMQNFPPVDLTDKIDSFKITTGTISGASSGTFSGLAGNIGTTGLVGSSTHEDVSWSYANVNWSHA